MWRIFLMSVIGGLLGWFAVGALLPVFRIPDELANLPSPSPPDKLNAAEAAASRAKLFNTMLGLALIGANVGLCAPFAVVEPGRSWTGVAAKSAAGFVAGGIFGALAGAFGHFTLEQLSKTGEIDSFQVSLACHSVALGILGLGLGLAMTTTWRDWRHLVAVGGDGLASGVIAGLLFVFLVGFFWPNVRTETVVPESAHVRMFWAFLATLLVTVAVVRRHRRRPSLVA